MPLANYTDLQMAVSAWLFNRQDLAAVTPDFITLAEVEANRVLSVRQMDTRATAAFDTTSDTPNQLAVPADFQSMRTIQILGGPPFLPSRATFMTNAQFEDKLDQLTNRVGVAISFPQWFTIYGNNLWFAPTPDQDYSVQMIYRANVPSLSADNPTNWLITEAPDVYLFGSLMQAAPYLSDDDRIPIWQSKYEKAIQQLQDLSEEALYNSGPLIMRTVRRRGY